MTDLEPVIRCAEITDIPLLVELRLAQMQSMQRHDRESLDRLAAATEAYLRFHLPDGSFRAWVTELEGQIVTCGGLVIRQAPPAYSNLSGREGYLMALYTRPEFRRRGLATALMQTILDHLRGEGLTRATLRASPEGRPLYEKLGFESSSEMKLRLSTEQSMRDEENRSADSPLIRAAGRADIPVLIELRLAMFQAMGRNDPTILAEVAAAGETYFNNHIPAGSYRGWLAEVDGQIAATGGLVMRQAPPTYHNLSGRDGYVMSVYTRPAFRHRGLATLIVNTILDTLRKEGINRVTLRASDEGRPLYEKLGFEPTTEMSLQLK